MAYKDDLFPIAKLKHQLGYPNMDDEQAEILNQMAKDLSAAEVLQELWEWVDADALGALVPDKLRAKVMDALNR